MSPASEALQVDPTTVGKEADREEPGYTAVTPNLSEEGIPF